MSQRELDYRLDETTLFHNAHVSQSFEGLPTGQEDPGRWRGGALLIHIPQSPENLLVLHALDTLRCEHVEGEWFRHLPAHFGHTRALDLSIRAIVAACAYSRCFPKLTSSDCYQALSSALDAVQAYIKQSQGTPNDHILASTALLAPFEGVIKKNGVPTRLHVDALAAILKARPASYPITQFATEIVDFHACESAVMACIQDIPSPFEGVSRAYFANDRRGHIDSDRARLKALGNELFVGIPRLVKLVRALRCQPLRDDALLLIALELSTSLSELQDPVAEERLRTSIKVQPQTSHDAAGSCSQSLHFLAVEDYEALAYYWQSRLSLLRLQLRLHDLARSSDILLDATGQAGPSLLPKLDHLTSEMAQLAERMLMCSEYAETLVLNKQIRLFAHATVVVWGVMLDASKAFSHASTSGAARSTFDMLLRRVNHALAAKPDLTAEDMNTAADVFVGGRPRGRFSQLYGS